MRKPAARFWVGSGLIAAATVLTVGDFLSQWRILGDGWSAVITAVPTAIKSGSAALGAYLLWRGWPRTVGRGVHCRRCGYRQEDKGRIIGPCPECGAPWRWIGRSRTGLRRGRSWMVTCGVALLLLVAGSWVVKQSAPWILLMWMPTDMLLQQIATLPEHELSGHWTELDERQVPKNKMEDLARALMRKKVRDGYLSRRSEGVIFIWMSGATQPAAVGRQYYSQVLSTVMDAPESIELGDQAAVKSQAIFRGGTIIAQPEPRVTIVSAIYIDGAVKPAETWVWPVRAVTDDQPRPFTHLYKPDQPGMHTLRQVFWLLIGGEGEITVNDDGPVLLPGMTELNEFEVGREIEVQNARTGEGQAARPSVPEASPAPR